jgi:hypothetical protein
VNESQRKPFCNEDYLARIGELTVKN